uniref:Uncharacterized protein n=1 Tax=Graphocephala atropunctata TaxID=36148 RepID=A0A1B6L5P1_9HEMI
MLSPCTLLVVAITLGDTGLQYTNGIPESWYHDQGKIDANSPRYIIYSNSKNTDGNCVNTISVGGRGISDTFKVPCSRVSNMNSLTTDTPSMVVGDKNTFCLYSDTLSTLVVIDDGKCTRRTYTTTGDNTTSVSTPMTTDECSAVIQKTVGEVEKNRKYWEEWEKNFEEEMRKRFPPGFPFNYIQKN